MVDGFNLYHSLDDASAKLRKSGQPVTSMKWLDLRGMLASNLSYIRGVGRAGVQSVYWFTALAHHIEQKKPGVVARHNAYIEALQSTGVQVVLGRFKKANPKTCPQCRTVIPRHEEKETDVNISVKLLELFVRDAADAVVIVSGDTDLIPAIRTTRTLFPTRPVGCLFPFARANDELKAVASFYASISKEMYARFQLPDPIVVAGRQRPIVKPQTW